MQTSLLSEYYVERIRPAGANSHANGHHHFCWVVVVRCKRAIKSRPPSPVAIRTLSRLTESGEKLY